MKESFSQCTKCCWIGIDDELVETTKIGKDRCAIPDYVCPKCGCNDLTYTYKSEWNCPDCHFEPPEFDGKFYKYDHEKNEIELKYFKDGVKVPEDYYPKFGAKSYRCQDMGYDWEEIHYCPNCKKEFSFINGS